ncbi:MAG: hypothetical protein H6595_01810 [Flavobacteriales bacterium]|nr:hypothetical protein [Flavobacteriales bacterium]MCB9166197.1 hypothetical protein [Flavobacteriales bacterium]
MNSQKTMSVLECGLSRALAIVPVLLALAGQAAPPANDDPCGATNLTVGASCSYSTGTNSGATASSSSIPAPGCANYQGGDVWFKCTVPASGALQIATATSSGSQLTDGGMAVYTASACSNYSSFALIDCDDDDGSGNMPLLQLNCLTPGAVIYIRFWEYGNNRFGNFRICVTSLTGGPANQDPCSATTLTVGTSCSSSSATNVNACNSSDTELPGCAAYSSNSKDVWFKFVAPASGFVAIESSSGSLTDGAMALYSAPSCSGPFDMIDCVDDTQSSYMPMITYSHLTPGDTYYVRFWGYGTASGTFNICVHSPALGGGSCSYLLEMFDSNGNGWGSSHVGISINGGAATNYTVTDDYNAVMLTFNIGDILVVTYDNSGSNQNQNSYLLRQLPGGQGIFNSGRNPSAGVVHTETVDCIPPSAVDEDCIGGITVCGSQSFSNNAQGVGFEKDLNANTFGCLAAGERQGTWYHIRASHGGTIGFTIAPANSGDDYDFALWGPMSSLSCPVDGAPARCSFSQYSGDTGLGNGASDTSEGQYGDKWVSTINVATNDVLILYISNFSQSGLQFDLNWTLTNGASLDCTVLPVELIGLEASAKTDHVRIDWRTATEHDLSHFQVERSADAEHFASIGQVTAMGNSLTEQNYALIDPEPLPGVNYYRLVPVDDDGTPNEGHIVSAYFARNDEDLHIYPQPVTDRLHVAFQLPQDGALLWRVTDPAGRTVDTGVMAGEHGRMERDIPLRPLDPGAYVLDILDRTSGTPLRQARFIQR